MPHYRIIFPSFETVLVTVELNQQRTEQGMENKRGLPDFYAQGHRCAENKTMPQKDKSSLHPWSMTGLPFIQGSICIPICSKSGEFQKWENEM